MNRRSFSWARVCTLPLLCSGALASSVFAAPAGAQPAPPAHVEGEILVRWSGQSTPPGLNSAISPIQNQTAQQNLRTRLSAKLPGASVERNFEGSGWSLVKVPAGVSSETALAKLKSTLGADNVALNAQYHASKVPNDPHYGQQWQWPQIKAPDAWNYTTGSSNIVVAVIDSGVDLTHPDLKANLWKNPKEIAGNGIDDDKNGYIDDVYGINGITGQANLAPQDDNGHGTHCAGLISAAGNNSLQVTGTAWNVKVMALKFLDSAGNGDDAGAIACLEYAVKMKKSGVNLRVISNSWSGRSDSAALKAAFQLAESAGILNVCAAGNGAGGGSGRDIDAVPEYPASYTLNSIVSVAASDSSDAVPYYSNYGVKSVDLVAPGDAILSLAKGGGEATMSGTSMATPIVAGAAALIAGRETSLSATQIKSRLISTVDKVPALTGKVVSAGRLNLYRAVANASYRISGNIYRLNGSTVVPLTGAIIKANGKTLTSTDSNGYYIINYLPPGSYRVQAALKNYTFLEKTVTLAPNATINFPAQAVPNQFYTLSGRAVGPNGLALKGVFIFMDGVPNAVASTNSSGDYLIKDRAFGTYILRASGGNYEWTSDPTSITLPRSSSVDPKAPNGTVNFFAKIPDTAAPQIAIKTPANGVTRSPGSVTATGTATDETGATKLYFKLTRTVGTSLSYYNWSTKAWGTDPSTAGVTGTKDVSGTNFNWSQALPSLTVASYSLRVWGSDSLGNISQGEADAVSSWKVTSTGALQIPSTITVSSVSGGNS